MTQLEEISIPAMTPLQSLAELQTQVVELDVQIEEAERAYGLDLLREHRAKKQGDYEAELARIAPSLTYAPDRVAKSKDSYREGSLKIMRSARTTRTVDTDRFAAAFPDLLVKVCEIRLTKADALIGKAVMDKYVEKKTTYSYDLINLEERP